MRAHVVLVLALAACDPQADGGYPGEAIAVLPGSVASPGGVVVDGMEIYWQDVDPRGFAYDDAARTRTSDSQNPTYRLRSTYRYDAEGRLLGFVFAFVDDVPTTAAGPISPTMGTGLATWTEHDAGGMRRTTYDYCD